MSLRVAFSTVLVFGFALTCIAQEKPTSTPSELEVVQASLGVWDAEIEVWPEGLDAASVKFKGVETNRPYGQYWLASDFDSEINGQTMKVHSIVGYDLGRKKLVGTVIDHGPYAASMTGDYDARSKTVTWITEAKAPDGTPMLQKTLVTHNSPQQRVLVLSVPGEGANDSRKLMQIKFVKRNQ